MLHFIGVGSAFNPEDGNTSAYFIHERSLYLIDCGGLVFKELIRLVDFNQIDQVEIFISHTHSDHIGSLGTLISYLYHQHQLISNVYHGGLKIKEYLDLVGLGEDYYEELTIQSVELAAGYFEWIPTKHSDKLASYGLLIKKEDKEIYYSADSAIIPERIYTDFIAGKIDELYQDVTLESENQSHLSLKALVDLIPHGKRKQVIAMHLDENSKKKIQAFGFNVAKRAKTEEKE